MEVFKNKFSICLEKKAEFKKQKPFVIWLTGISCSGKSSVANCLEKTFFAFGKHVVVLDGDNLRAGLNSDLGFSREDRKENIRRIAEVAKLFFENGDIVIVSAISPYAEDRLNARMLFDGNSFYEVLLDVSIETAINRDKKGLYKKALEGKLDAFPGINMEYQMHDKSILLLNTNFKKPQEISEIIIKNIPELVDIK